MRRLHKNRYQDIVIRSHAVNVDDKLIDNFARPPQDPNPRGPICANTVMAYVRTNQHFLSLLTEKGLLTKNHHEGFGQPGRTWFTTVCSLC